MYYKEDRSGQMLQEGINEAGAMASWIAAATSYSNSNVPMIPFYIYYSMFGFQRIGDLAWAAGDMRARGFLLGGTSGRTTLNGEGLQHEDGHSHIFSATIPNCVSYDPTFAYEVAVHRAARAGAHVWQGRGRLLLPDPAQRKLRASRHAGRRRGGHRQGHVSASKRAPRRTPKDKRVQLLGCGAILREVIAGAALLEKDFGVHADIWSVTSFTELTREARRRRALEPAASARRSRACPMSRNASPRAASGR